MRHITLTLFLFLPCASVAAADFCGIQLRGYDPHTHTVIAAGSDWLQELRFMSDGDVLVEDTTRAEWADVPLLPLVHSSGTSPVKCVSMWIFRGGRSFSGRPRSTADAWTFECHESERWRVVELILGEGNWDHDGPKLPSTRDFRDRGNDPELRHDLWWVPGTSDFVACVELVDADTRAGRLIAFRRR